VRAERGYRGSASTLREWVYLHVRGREARRSDASLPRTAHPSARRSAWLLTKPVDALTDPEKAYVSEVCPEIRAVRTLVVEFQRILRERDANALGPWLETARRTELRQLAVGLEHDRDALLGPSASIGATGRQKAK